MIVYMINDTYIIMVSKSRLESQGTLMSPNNFLFLGNFGYITYGIRAEGYNTWTSGQGQIILSFYFLLKKKN
jgi:hypothetical protein